MTDPTLDKFFKFMRGLTSTEQKQVWNTMYRYVTYDEKNPMKSEGQKKLHKFMESLSIDETMEVFWNEFRRLALSEYIPQHPSGYFVYGDTGEEIRVGDDVIVEYMTTRGGPCGGKGKVVKYDLNNNVQTVVVEGEFDLIGPQGYLHHHKRYTTGIYDSTYDYANDRYITNLYKTHKGATEMEKHPPYPKDGWFVPNEVEVQLKVPIQHEQEVISLARGYAFKVGTDAYYEDPDNYVTVIIRSNESKERPDPFNLAQVKRRAVMNYGAEITHSESKY